MEIADEFFNNVEKVFKIVGQQVQIVVNYTARNDEVVTILKALDVELIQRIEDSSHQFRGLMLRVRERKVSL